MLRRSLASERVQRVDPEMGIKVIQLTSYPTPSAHFLYDRPFITPDNGRVVLFCQRAARRDAPWDLFRVDTDGLNLFQLTERGECMEAGGYYGRPSAHMTLDGKTVYCVWDRMLCTVDVETGDIEDLCSLERHCPEGSVIGQLYISATGRRLFVRHHGPAGEGVVRVDLDTGETTAISVAGHLFACDPTGPRLVGTQGEVEYGTVAQDDGTRIVTNQAELLGKWLVDEDGADIEYFCPDKYAHATLLGGQLKLQGCGKPPDKCIWLAEKGREPYKLVEGPYFWHSGASWDGEWIVADTNWPDQGLQLVHVATGRFATLCHTGASQDHYEFGHPHPALSQDGRLCVFRSDRTGVPQLYIAHITAEFQERLIEGELTGPRRWAP